MKKTLKNILLSATLGVGLLFNSCSLKYKLGSNYSGVVVFAYNNERFTQEDIEKNKLELTTTTYKEGLPIYSQEDWWDIQADKYDKDIYISLEFYPEEVKIPEEMKIPQEIVVKKFYRLKLDILADYLRKEYPKLEEYDFLSIVYEDMNTNEIKTQGAALPYKKIFYVDGVRFSNERGGFRYMGNVFAHEFAHLIGASDKYNPDDSTNKTDKLDLMRDGSYNTDNPIGQRRGALTEQVKITEPTAEEIGWLNQ